MRHEYIGVAHALPGQRLHLDDFRFEIVNRETASGPGRELALHDESPVQRYSRHRHPDTPERTVHASIIAVEKCLDRLPEDFPADRNAQPLEAVPSHELNVEHESSSMNVCGILLGETRCCTCSLLSPLWRG